MRREAIERLLPTVYQVAVQPGSPLTALLEAMEELHARDERILERIHEYFDPYLTPPELVPFLCQWVDLDWLLADPASGGAPRGFSAGLGRLRNLIALAPELSAHRGTAEGLRRFLETATGVAGFDVDDSGADPPFHVRVSVPESAGPLHSLVDHIVHVERPAHATYEIHYPETDGAADETEGAGASRTQDIREPLDGGRSDDAASDEAEEGRR